MQNSYELFSRILPLCLYNILLACPLKNVFYFAGVYMNSLLWSAFILVSTISSHFGGALHCFIEGRTSFSWCMNWQPFRCHAFSGILFTSFTYLPHQFVLLHSNTFYNLIRPNQLQHTMKIMTITKS